MTTKQSVLTGRELHLTTGGEPPSAEVWAIFIKKLAAALKERDVGDLLTLQAKHGGEWIQFATEKRSFRITP